MNPNVTYFKEAGYGMMMHFGLYSLLSGEYKGKPSSAYAEWIGAYHAIPIAEYEKLASVFNPSTSMRKKLSALQRKSV